MYQVNLDQGFERAQEIMAVTIRRDIERDIGGDHQRIHGMDTHYGEISFKHILLPVWMSAFRFRDKTYRFVVNGRTGEVQVSGLTAHGRLPSLFCWRRWSSAAALWSGRTIRPISNIGLINITSLIETSRLISNIGLIKIDTISLIGTSRLISKIGPSDRGWTRSGKLRLEKIQTRSVTARAARQHRSRQVVITLFESIRSQIGRLGRPE